jgi:uracil-DNA glycosylase
LALYFVKFYVLAVYEFKKPDISGLLYFYTNLLIMEVKMEASWKAVLKNEFTKPYFQQIVTFLKTEKAAGKIIYPPGPLIFNAFNQTPFTKLKVVLLGQDPYHGPGQAHGLSFSVQNGIKPPPSLVNIFKEIQTDIGVAMPVGYGNLTKWAEQGVLLLNAALSVRADEPFSHAKFGWADFTDAVIKKISDEKKGIVFLLWGKFAQEKQSLIDETKHFVLKAAHPSPFSADKGFFGCKHFSKTNELLVKQGLPPIDWKLLTP